MPIPASFPLAEAAESGNIAALASLKVERFTGGTSATLTLINTAVEGLEQVFKNGTLLDPGNPTGAGAYFISGNTVTLGTAPAGTDVLIVRYYFRASR